MDSLTMTNIKLNSPIVMNIDYEWIIEQIQLRLAEKHNKSTAWNDVKTCLRELDLEQYD